MGHPRTGSVSKRETLWRERTASSGGGTLRLETTFSNTAQADSLRPTTVIKAARWVHFR
jgi:hypothetical protein